MNDRIYVKPDTYRLLNLLDDMANGIIQIPLFQRDFIWEKKQILNLFDSIARGYPIGSLLFWNPEMKYRIRKQVGAFTLPANEKKSTYVLDGSQRITTLFNALTNYKKYENVDKELLKKKFTVYYDLWKKEFVYSNNPKDQTSQYISLYQIIDTYEFLDFLREIETQNFDKNEVRILIDNAKAISKIFYDYQIPYVEIKGGDLKSAADIFSRINSKGTEISEDFMLSALSYNDDTGFVFSEKITEFVESLQKYNFEDLKRDTILYCIANAKDKVYFDVKTEELLAPNLEETANNAFIQIEKAIEFLYKRLFVLHAKLLPYPTQLIFIANFFRLNPNPSEYLLKKLEDWFWITTYSNYFTLYSLSQQRSAHNVFCEFAKGNHDNGIFVLNDKFNVAEFPKKLDFTGVRTKALQLFMLKSILKNEEIPFYETVREFIIFNAESKKPANVLLRLGSEFETDKMKKEAKNFISQSENSILEKYFISDKIKKDFLRNDIDNFMQEREKLIIEQEQLFINQFSDFLAFNE